MFSVCLLVVAGVLNGDVEAPWRSNKPETEKLPESLPVWFKKRWLKGSVGSGGTVGSKRGWRWFGERVVFICLGAVEEHSTWQFLLVEAKGSFRILDGN